MKKDLRFGPRFKSTHTDRRSVHKRGLLAILMASVMSLGILMLSHANADSVPNTNSRPSVVMTEQGAAQIAILDTIKNSLTRTQQKIDWNLLLAWLHERRDLRLLPLKSYHYLLPESDGRVTVEILSISADRVDKVRQNLNSLNAPILTSYEISTEFLKIVAMIRLRDLEVLSEMKEIRKIRPVSKPVVNKINVSEGDVSHDAVRARTSFFAARGKGVKVCVLSNGVDTLEAAKSSGDLPGVKTLPGQEGFGNEGTAMLEIIHDLAPEAELGFATAGFVSKTTVIPDQFAKNIRDLADDGCSIIVDDVDIPERENAFGDGEIAQAVDYSFSKNVIYFAAAGNSGNKTDKTSGTWEGDFKASLQPVPASLNERTTLLHDFGDGLHSIEVVHSPDFGQIIILTWAEHFTFKSGNAAVDYDLYLMNGDLTEVKSVSNNVQDGNADGYPFEYIANSKNFFGTALVQKGDRIVISRKGPRSSSPPMIRLTTGRGILQSDLATTGHVYGHAAAKGAIAVAATPACLYYPEESGRKICRSPAPFSPSSKSETFSSDGPRRIIFDKDGNLLTPELGARSRSSSGGELRQKPDITAADGVATSDSDFNPFFGTSAAAPHAAAIAALIKSAVPTLTAAEIRDVMIASAIDIEKPGYDDTTGHGVVMPTPALELAGATPLAGTQFLSVNNVQMQEGGAGETPVATFTVTLSRVSSTPVTFMVTTASGSATSGRDFTALQKPFTIRANTRSVAVPVSLRGDADIESDEIFYVNLSTPSEGVTISDGQGKGIIQNDDHLPELSLTAGEPKSEGDSGITYVDFTATLTSAANVDITFKATPTNGSASTADRDFAGSVISARILKGKTSTVFSVPINGDTKVEPDENFVVTLTKVSSGAKLAKDKVSANGVIRNDDIAVISLVDASAAVEGSSAVFTVTTSKPSSTAISLTYTTEDGSAKAGQDYRPVTAGTVSIPATKTSAKLSINTLNDALFDPNESFGVRIFNPPMGIMLGRGSATAQIIDDEVQPELRISDVAVAEGDSGTKKAAFTVTLSSASASTITVNAATTSGGTATAGVDYTALSSKLLTFNPGDKSKTINVTVRGDAAVEDNETFFVTLSNSSGGTPIAKSKGIGTISDDDSQRRRYEFLANCGNWFQCKSAAEGRGAHLVTIGSDEENSTVTSLFPSFTTGVWIGLSDLAAEGRYEWVTGEPLTYSKPLVADNFGGAQNCFYFTSDFGEGREWGDIECDVTSIEGAVIEFEGVFENLPSLTINDLSVVEGNGGTGTLSFVVNLSAASKTAVSVAYSTSNVTASAGRDYVATSGTLTFVPHVTQQKININVLGDVDFEPDEVFNVNLSSASGATIGRAVGIGTISNDDSQKKRYELLVNCGDWFQCKSAAEVRGAHLATIQNSDEQRLVAETIGSNAYTWIGFSDLVKEGSFSWTTGEPVTFTAWGAGEPNNAIEGEHCGMVDNTQLHYNYNWADAQCSNSFPSAGFTPILDAVIEYEAVDVRAGLVGQYSFENCSSFDSSGRAHNGIVYGAPSCVAGRVGASAMRFDGMDDEIRIANDFLPVAPSVASPFSYSLWMRTSDGAKTGGGLVTQQTACINGPNPGLIEDDAFSLTLFGSVGNPDGGSLQSLVWHNLPRASVRAPEVANGEWHHVAIVHEGAQQLLYLDGVLRDIQPVSPDSSKVDFTRIEIVLGGFAADDCGYNLNFSGDLDEVRLYNRPLNFFEVQELRAAN